MRATVSRETLLLTDPFFYFAAVPAVILYGIAKGGFAGGFGIVAVPVMALAVSPLQAAAILLPILCIMDLVALWKYRGRWVLSELTILIPAALIGIVVGTMLFSHLSPAIIRLLLGAIAIVFGRYKPHIRGHVYKQRLREGDAASQKQQRRDKETLTIIQ